MVTPFFISSDCLPTSAKPAEANGHTATTETVAGVPAIVTCAFNIAAVVIEASPGEPPFYQWDIDLEELRRNPFRTNVKLGG